MGAYIGTSILPQLEKMRQNPQWKLVDIDVDLSIQNLIVLLEDTHDILEAFKVLPEKNRKLYEIGSRVELHHCRSPGIWYALLENEKRRSCAVPWRASLGKVSMWQPR